MEKSSEEKITLLEYNVKLIRNMLESGVESKNFNYTKWEIVRLVVDL